MGELKKMKKATDVTVGKVKKAAGEFKKGFTEETDIFDIVLEYLINEGYADTDEAAIVIMANMSEDWKQSIIEGKKEIPNIVVRKQMERKNDDDFSADKTKNPKKLRKQKAMGEHG